MNRPIATFLVLAAVLAGRAGAGEWTLTLDPERTRIGFTLGATLHAVHGSARLVEGTIRFDPEAGTASGHLVVDAGSMETGNKARDEDMHVKVLESERFPTIAFRPARIAGDLAALARGEPAAIELAGSLEIHGGSHDVTLAADTRREGERLVASGAFTVPYVAWGMKDPSKFMLRVAKQVEVTLEAVGDLRPPDPEEPVGTGTTGNTAERSR